MSGKPAIAGTGCQTEVDGGYGPSKTARVIRLPLIESRSAVYQPMPPRPPEFFGVEELTDPQGRRYDYLRLSVTDRCDLACVYCMPPGGEDEHARRKELLSFEEAARLVQVFASAGIKRVRLTGGEPLVRKDIVRLVDLLHRRGVDEIVMTTNATRLSELARPLARAGLRGVNVSIDTLDAERFEAITRGGDLGRVLAGIHAACDAGLEVKLNTVLLRDQTIDEAETIVDFAWQIGATPRFIELMPIGEGDKLPRELRVPAAEVVELLGDKLRPRTAAAAEPGRGPARYLDANDGSGKKVGFITPMSDEFCDTCNRVRVTARGDIRACLASRRAVNLRDIMRAGGTDLDVAWAIYWSLCEKRDGHFFLDSGVDEHARVGMSLIGG